MYGEEEKRQYSIYRRPLAGGTADLVLKTEVVLHFRCAAEAGICVIADQTGDQLRISSFRVDTGERHDLTTAPLTSVPMFSLTPDGTRLALIRAGDEPPKEIDIYDLLSGKRVQQVEAHPTGMLVDVGWAGDNAVVATALSAGGGCDVLRIDLQGRERTLWHDSHFLRWPTVSLDGRHVAFFAASGKVNAWLVEGLQ